MNETPDSDSDSALHSRPPNIFFRLVVLVGGLFVVTILAQVAVMFGNPDAPINGVIDRHAGSAIGIEVGLILLFGLAALIVDRRQSLHDQQRGSTSAGGADKHGV